MLSSLSPNPVLVGTFDKKKVRGMAKQTTREEV
jgi:hypothetical protein